MREPERVENVVLGGGEAGKYIAWELAAQGRRVVVVERSLIGGSCPNIACLPSKNVIRSAEVAHLVAHAAEYGVRVGGDGQALPAAGMEGGGSAPQADPASGGSGPEATGARVDMRQVRQRKRDMVDGLIATHQKRFDHENIEFLLAEGSLVGPRTVEARRPDGGTRLLKAERLFLNLGTRPSLPAIPGLAEAAPLTHIEALELGHLPRHLIVIGGGYVGIELAQAFRRFGSEVTVIQRGARLLSREDPDVGAAVRELFEDEGIRVLTEAETLSVEGRSSEGVRLRVRHEAGEKTIEGSDLLVAAGRTPNTHGIGLERAGIELDERGFVKVDEKLRASAPGVWAMGECAGSPQFTHVAFDDFRIVRDDVVRDGLARKERSTRGRLVPFCAFIDPELARVGLDETEAARQGVAVRVARLPVAAVLRARSLGETRGYMKMLIAADSDGILGFTMLGHNAGEVVAVVQLAMLGGLPYTALRDAILTHPTMAEGLTVLLAGVAPRA